jgi:hypothetical protein
MKTFQETLHVAKEKMIGYHQTDSVAWQLDRECQIESRLLQLNLLRPILRRRWRILHCRLDWLHSPRRLPMPRRACSAPVPR